MQTERARGQVALEFICVLALALIFFSIMQLFVASQGFSAQGQRAQIEAQQLALQWADAVELAGGSSGYSAQLSVPFALDASGTAFSLQLSNRTVTVGWTWGLASQSLSEPVQAYMLTNSTGATSLTLAHGKTYVVSGANGFVSVYP
jgi:hypothetical protein